MFSQNFDICLIYFFFKVCIKRLQTSYRPSANKPFFQALPALGID